ncbi:phosphatidylethanolamine N-methyltransferase isoform X8 [Suricata suricatta]|uniref:phosphatidylethanolamine N-methyltransferase isoform X8 n=1 Tax=Suricata suricatta TaxID=37032 RepID=UPI0011554E53|nr:phosphatidylethanolamine N-methyltransferase isoform X8 [Suricata suricatta]
MTGQGRKDGREMDAGGFSPVNGQLSGHTFHCKCAGWERLCTCALHTHADLCVMTWLLGYVDPSDPGFVAAILIITFNPLFWNVVARWEHRTRKLSKAFRSPYLACYSLGAAILLLNILRSHWRLLRDPYGGQSDHIPIQHPGQPHVLGQHSQLPGLGHYLCPLCSDAPSKGRAHMWTLSAPQWWCPVPRSEMSPGTPAPPACC